MLDFAPEETETLLYLKDKRWYNSTESIVAQKVTKLTKSESALKISSKLGSNITFSELELREINVNESKLKGKWEIVREKSRFPRMIQTRSLLRDELEMLKINMSIHEKVIALKEYQMLKDYQIRSKRKKKTKSFVKYSGKLRIFFQKLVSPRFHDLVTEIEGSESAKTDTVIWKFLKRKPLLRRELVNSQKFLLGIQNLYLPDSHYQKPFPTRITCPNCRFFVTTNVKKISTFQTKIFSFVLTIIRFCINPHIFYTFKSTVHLCPLCKIYLGFCPAFGIQSRRRNQSKLPKEKKIVVALKENKVESKKMVSASSTSAKNLFVESKLRLSDRVQVNVNNIAAVARQIQRGSKANETLIAAAKNFALQEAAIENSETNLKKLKLLTTHINNQLDSLHNSSAKMELVLEQVRSMQR